MRCANCLRRSARSRGFGFSTARSTCFPACRKILFSCDSLADLDIDGNQLDSLPASVKELTALRWLMAGRNRLATLPREIADMPHLERLSVEGNRLAALPDGIGACRELYMLDASGNMLAALPQGICALTALRVLRLAHNRLAALPPCIDKLNRLRVEGQGGEILPALDIADNRLCNLDTVTTAWADTLDPGWRSTQRCTEGR